MRPLQPKHCGEELGLPFCGSRKGRGKLYSYPQRPLGETLRETSKFMKINKSAGCTVQPLKIITFEHR